MTEEQKKKNREKSRLWRLSHPNRQREWRAENPDKVREYNLRSKINNAESRRVSARKYYHSHVEKCKADRKKWRQANRERVKQNLREWHNKNPHWDRDRARAIKKEVFQHYGNACACCGESRLEFLTIDHIEGGGTKHREQLGAVGSNFYKWLKKNNFPPGYQPLCWNCNCARGFFGICPHERERQAQAAD